MNYKKIYQNIIDNGVGRQKKIGLERHHILPKSCGGTDDKQNLVYLTTREHFICHRLLVKIYKDNIIFRKKMIYALWWMSKTRNNLNNCRVTSRVYETIKKEFILNNPNSCEKQRKKFIENHKAGKYKYDYNKVSLSLKQTLSELSKSEMYERMKKSALSCDQEKRKNSIRLGKGSQLKLTLHNNDIITFWSYEDVKKITGYTYEHIRYRIRKYDGVLENGSKVEYILRYDGNDKRIGRKRNNRVPVGEPRK